ncbi:hypothetical protein SAMN02799631_02360 [Methylobacterium sp. 174MFSha1.1]|uniref:hypothetical protein n=1 Tax=Methylobacterium sp. 174MFSha1.1 TaxID=1502749 RepID=UPI0008EDB1CE|nr:hypothetical protein [Methylobacterium sp. 174MFSha1.1]SFU79516.1 hypothetical protein SAMN02799631_02360 [Methylobacterium sp. 174MFSha1.1]
MGPALSATVARLERDVMHAGRVGRPAVPPVAGHPVDRRLILAAALGLAGSLALTGVVAAWLARPMAPAGPVVVSTLAARPLVLPAAWIVRPVAAAEATSERIDLAIPWTELTGSALPGLMRVTATRAPETEAPLSPARRYARFLTAEAQPLTDGLMRRRFRAGTPFEGEDLYLAQGEGSRFAVRCATGRVPEPDAACLSEIRVGSVSLRLRFSADRLPSWSAGLAGLERLFGSTP